jgi:hypothetical protein
MAASVHKLNFGSRKPRQRTRNSLLEERRGRRGVKLVTLFNMLDIQKDYGSCTMVYDGRRIRKLVQGHDVSGWLTRSEMKRFVIDIINAAKVNKKIRE